MRRRGRFCTRSPGTLTAMKPRVLVVDDDRQRGEMLSVVLAEGYECQGAFTLDEAFATVGRSEWEAVMVDYDLGPQGSGLELLQALREFSPRTLRVLYSEHYCNGLARDASRLAAAHAVVDARLPDFLLTLHHTLDRLLLLPSPGSPGPLRAPELDEPVWFTVS